MIQIRFASLKKLHLILDGQCFPLYLYESNEIEGGLFAFSRDKSSLLKTDSITENTTNNLRKKYSQPLIQPKDIFYYIYSLFHMKEYKNRFFNNLSRELARIPFPNNYENFKEISEAGFHLGNLHVNFKRQKNFPSK